ncbi:MAG: hypothetical protein HYX92_16790 [Chloroflexi bacterium]|nr:hypothetical protein [Chloroflexota bacterium]
MERPKKTCGLSPFTSILSYEAAYERVTRRPEIREETVCVFVAGVQVLTDARVAEGSRMLAETS